MSSRIRVLFLNDHLGHEGGAIHGATRYFLDVLPRIDRNAVDLKVCFLRAHHPAASILAESGVEPLFLERARWDLRALFDLIRLIREHDTQLIHAAGMKGMLLGRIAGRWTGARTVIHLHDMEPIAWPLRLVQRGTRSWTARAIAVSKPVAEFACEVLGIRRSDVVVLHNGVVLQRFRSDGGAERARVLEELGIPNGARVIGVVGRLAPGKGQETLIRSLPKLMKAVPQAFVLLVGDGSERGRYEALAARLGVADRVVFAGHRADVPRILDSLDVVVVPSIREGLCYAALEALAAGKPLVASAVGGIPEVVEHAQSGWLVPPGDPNELAAAVSLLLTDAALSTRLAQAGRERAQSFGIAAHVRTLEEIYTSVMSSPQP